MEIRSAQSFVIATALLICAAHGPCPSALARAEDGRRAAAEEGSSARSPARIPFTISRNRIILPVRAGKSRLLNVMLDTGMHTEGLLIYKESLTKQVALENAAEVLVGGAGAGPLSRALMSDSASFSVGDVTFSEQPVYVLQEGGMERFPGDGITGYSLFGSYVVEIDYDDSVITLHDPARFEPPEGRAWIPLSFRDNMIPWVEVNVDVRGEGSVPLSLYIDLASGEAIELLIRDGMKYALPDSLREHYLGRGLSGDIFGHRGIIRRLEIGPYALHDVRAAFASAEVRSKQPGADGVLSNNALRRFNVIFDYAARRLYLEPNRAFGEPFH